MSAGILRDDPDTLGWNAFSERYASFEQEFTLLPVQTVASLLKAEKILQVMMLNGVHLWDGFEDAMIEAQKIDEDL